MLGKNLTVTIVVFQFCDSTQLFQNSKVIVKADFLNSEYQILVACALHNYIISGCGDLKSNFSPDSPRCAQKYSSTATLQHHNTAALQHRNIVALQHCSTATSQHHNTTASKYRSTAPPQHCNTVPLPPQHCSIAMPHTATL